MDIVERYLAAYVVECLTGIPGANSTYYSILSETRSNTQHPLLKQVLAETHDREPRDVEVKEKVRSIALNYLKTKFPNTVSAGRV